MPWSTHASSCSKGGAMKEQNENKVELDETAVENTATCDSEAPLDKNIRLMSPTRMVVRRFFRSKLSVVGLVMLAFLFIFCFLGPVVYNEWGEIEVDESPMVEYTSKTITYEENGKTHTIYQVTEKTEKENALAPMSKSHPLGTDETGYDVLARLMYGGRISLIIGFISVFIITILGVILGGIAGYFGGIVDNVIMRICDVLMCIPGFPIMLVFGTVLTAFSEMESPSAVQAVMGDPRYRIYFLMAFLTLFSWPGTARLVRGQILSLREQEYMVAAEAMGYSTGRKIFKHLVPNVMPQLIVSMTLSLGSMILYEASLSFLNMGVQPPYAAWGTMINAASDLNILENFMNIWAPPGICIVIAVLGFNFVGDGLRDALDPKARR
ncbi:MAG: ABC transporter permease [Ruminococcaceae bacterium]|nr:ABC transporter permease [Oscillospiraceae bacterium]